MNYVEIMGLAAGALTTFSLLPQLIKVIKRKSAKDLSRTWLVASGVGFVLWTGYGYLSASVPLVLFSAVSFLLSMTILALKLRYK